MVGAEREENDLSIAMLIQYGYFDSIFTGDLGGGQGANFCLPHKRAVENVIFPFVMPLAEIAAQGAFIPSAMPAPR